MKRVVVAAVAVCLGVCSVLAASPKIEAALKTFKSVAADPGKLKTFCEMDSAMEAASEKGGQGGRRQGRGAHEAAGGGFPGGLECRQRHR